MPQALLDQPEKLARYRVLYLADVPCLTPRQVANLDRFVEQGGGLVASYATSLYGPTGQRLERFALENLLQVRPARIEGELAGTLESYRCMTGGPNDLYLLARDDSRKTATPAQLIPVWHFEPTTALERGLVTWEIVTGDGHKPVLPGVVTARHGKGRVVYLASSLESLYGPTRQELLGNFLRRLVVEAAGVPPPCQVDGPPSLIANLTQNENRRVLHLLNWTGDAANEANYLPSVENVIVRLTLPDGRKVRRVSAFLETPWRQKRSAQHLELRIPRVDAYQAIRIELE